ncbi:Extracellular serine protease precursor [hydrothermal vent metagenome]|uniref:Extracellular serine protease n=1 Tax=hydrothermal vent metagenome TaxID=652676 RepID=A0A1W1C880_9ZZZZ
MRILLSLLVISLAGCGGGGGNTVPTPIAPTPIIIKQPTGFNARETLYQGANVSAYSNKGSNITIAVIDSGVNKSHILFRGASFSIARTNIASPTMTPYDILQNTGGHGTGVASVINSNVVIPGITSRIGLAPSANVLDIGLSKSASDYNTNGFTNDNIIKAFDYARTNNADILNLSFGSEKSGNNVCSSSCLSAKMNKAYIDVINSNKIIVQAAGNDGQTNPSVQAQFAILPEAKGQMLAVGALNEDGSDIASFSNKAGNTKKYFLLAPGTNIPVASADSSVNNLYKYSSGTSFAAPIVSAAAALVWSQARNLSASQVINILLSTADDMGVAGVDNIYGHGKLNLANALTPQGAINFSIPLGSTVYQKTSLLSIATINSNNYSDVITTLKNSNLLKKAIFLDKYKRAYNIDLTGYINNSTEKKLFSKWENYFNKPKQNNRNISFGSNLIGNFNLTINNNHTINNLSEAGFNLNYEFKDLAINYINISLGYANSKERNYKKYFFYKTTYNLQKNTDITFGLLNVYDKKGNFLNTNTNGAFSLDDAYETNYYNFNLSHKFNANHSVSFNYSFGNGKTIYGNSIIRKISNIKLSAIELLFNIKNNNKHLTFGIESPMNINQGTILIKAPISVDSMGNVLYEQEQLSLAQKMQFNVITNYKVDINNEKSLLFYSAVNTQDINKNSFGIKYNINF